MKDVCGLVADRCSVLLGIALVAVVQHVRENSGDTTARPTVVTFDGGCYENFKNLRMRIRAATDQMLGGVEWALCIAAFSGV